MELPAELQRTWRAGSAGFGGREPCSGGVGMGGDGCVAGAGQLFDVVCVGPRQGALHQLIGLWGEGWSV